MDVSKINDLNQLKAMAYDQLAAKDQAERNFALINNRIVEVLATSSPAVKPPVEPPKDKRSNSSKT